jgi:hypothetical protein
VKESLAEPSMDLMIDTDKPEDLFYKEYIQEYEAKQRVLDLVHGKIKNYSPEK